MKAETDETAFSLAEARGDIVEAFFDTAQAFSNRTATGVR